ncbi:ATP-binding cassette domain-containing protein [Haploplasma axanthum]|uniref:Phosphate ABC transporter ATP-binding protein n=1 Tax=Haploplasma axanthum TaxID=29552 RepID=A0A449BCB1_HAPAX|nr:ATP-binding cassette domain-containing protein [Haploplasma axanthum]VEU80072.1 phosphate ABC transporter ATP-binding protein [Haploplasma axanthum]
MKENKILLNIKNLQKYFPIKKKNIFQKEQEYVKANKNINLTIYEGETLGIVGESGYGKSTFGRTIIQLQNQTGGSSLYYGDTISNFLPKYVKRVYKNIPKVSKNYDVDAALMQDLKCKIKDCQDKECVEKVTEEYRLEKIKFQDKYYNTLRLIGGLAAYDSLEVIKELLLKKYQLEKKLKKYEKKNKERYEELLLLKNDNEEAIQKIKNELKNDERFIKYEEFRDDGIDLSALTSKEKRKIRKELQIIFQDPYSSLDPKTRIIDIIGEGLLIHKKFKTKYSDGYREYVLEIMEKCGLDKEYANRYPHEFSGGQRQRVGIARALALNPCFVVCDEAVSALDVSIQSQIINLLQELKDEHNLTYLFITHDLGVVRYISDRIGVMYFGNLVELAPAEELFSNPKHPYTKQLLNAILTLEDDEVKKVNLEIDYDSKDYEFKYQLTGEADPDWYEVEPNHFVACRLKNKELV